MKQQRQQPRQSYNELDETEQKVSQKRDNHDDDITLITPKTAVKKPSKYRLILCVFIILLLTAGGLLVFFSTKEEKSTSHTITENSDNNETSMNAKVNENTTTGKTNKPTTTVETNKPTTDVNTKKPTTTVNTDKPTTTVETSKLTTDVNTNKPTTTVDTNKPTTVADTKKTATIVKTRSYSLPDNFSDVYPDLTQLKGKHKEAYAFLFCTPKDADQHLQENWLGMRAHIGKLTDDGALEQRDLVIMTCPYVPKWQLDILHKTGAIVANVELIITTRPVLFPSWKTVFTKLHSYQLIQWERVLYMDIDILPMNGFYDIWDEPATQLVTKPPPGVDLNSTWYGQKVSDLYPYIQSGTFDTWVLDWAKQNYYFNGGLYVIKPSLPHWYALMNVTYDYSIELVDMDQRCVNTVYKGTGPVPWHNFSIFYDYSPSGLPVVPEVRAYHVKSWGARDGRIFISSFWERYDKMIKASYNIAIIPESVNLTIINTKCVQIDKLKLSTDSGSLYYWVNVDQTIQPTQEEIKAQSLKMIPISDIDEASITVDNLLPNQIYNIFYFAETTNKLNTKTDVYQVSFSI